MGEKKRRAAAGGTWLRQAQEMHRANRLAEAKALYRKALGIAPSQWEAWLGLGVLASDAGALDAAVEALSKAVALAPESAEVRVHHARALLALGRHEPAAAEFAALCALRPDDPAAWESLGIARQAIGETELAAQAYQRACAIGQRASARLKLATLVSPVVASCEALRAERAQIEAQLDALSADASLALEDPMRASLWSNFYLAFHGENDRALQSRYAALYLRICPSLGYVSPHARQPRRPGRIRVGLLSSFFRNHSIGRTSRGLFAQLSRDEFEVWAIFVAPVADDDFARVIRENAEHSLVLPNDLAEARLQVGALGLDILFYQDIGMDPFTYFLAFARLAPVQCVSFGHPDTTGIPAMDYFVSNDLYEPPDAAGHYSERLFLLHDLGSLAYYYRPEPASPLKPRSAFGLGESDHLYLCPQNLFKFHPDMDGLIEGILRGDPLGRLAVIEGRVPHWTDLLRRRWSAAMPGLMDRVVFLPRQDERDYLNLIALADVMLDTVHFNGMNTSLEALSVGTPVVTWPGEFQRGRHTQAMYRKMGFADCLARDAGEYVDLAIRLGTDGAYRSQVKAEILRRCGVLFEDARVVREFERFFRDAMAATGSGA